jgi:hypothetical protein
LTFEVDGEQPSRNQKGHALIEHGQVIHPFVKTRFPMRQRPRQPVQPASMGIKLSSDFFALAAAKCQSFVKPSFL